MNRSPSSSPLRKKARLSSPTYDTLFDELDVEEHEALDAIEVSLSQNLYDSSHHSVGSAENQESPDINTAPESYVASVKPTNNEDTQSKAAQKSLANASLSLLRIPPFISSSDKTFPDLLNGLEHFSLPEISLQNEPPVVPSLTPQLPESAPVSTLSLGPNPSEHVAVFLSANPDKVTSSRWVLPSASALEKAQQKFKQWELEMEKEPNIPPVKSARQPFQSVENTVAKLTTETTSVQPALKTPGPSSSSILNPVLARTSAGAEIGFVRPSPPLSQPSTPTRPALFIPPRPMTKFSIAADVPTKPQNNSTFNTLSSTSTPDRLKSLGLTPRARAFSGSPARPKFVTPFKPGMRPGDYTRATMLENSRTKMTSVSATIKGKGVTIFANPANMKGRTSVESKDHCKSSRGTLAKCGLVPQTYDIEELEAMGIDTNLLQLTDLSQYLYYRFNHPGSLNASTQSSLGPDTALAELHIKGHLLATAQWVNNHWSLILWKMIGMGCLDPESYHQRWSWSQIMKQLEYRYNRELEGGSRPAFRLITTQDAPSGAPMILCISNVFWIDEYVNESDQHTPGHFMLEVTDGWYRLRAAIDEPLTRALLKKTLRIGRKIACCGAKLVSSKKSPIEVLQAYHDVCLKLCGNSTHLAPWHAKLGFQKTSWIATLNSLSPDGGNVPFLDIVIVQIHPVGYIEFVETRKDKVCREGPRTEKDEAVEHERWQARCALEASKLHQELDNKLQRLENYIYQLDGQVGGETCPTDEDDPPCHLENLVDALEEDEKNAQKILRSVRGRDAGWLSLLLRKKCEADRLQARENIEHQLNLTFPPRRVRNFRVLCIKDTVSKRRSRVAQLTVWDVMSLQTAEGGSPGSFAVEQRYLVSNLIPSQQSAWMGLEVSAEIFLSTTRNSKWRLIN